MKGESLEGADTAASVSMDSGSDGYDVAAHTIVDASTAALSAFAGGKAGASMAKDELQEAAISGAVSSMSETTLGNSGDKVADKAARKLRDAPRYPNAGSLVQ